MFAAVLSGIAGVVTFAGPPLVSSVWFPAHQRATSTAIVSLFNYAGVAVAFVLGKIYGSTEQTYHWPFSIYSAQHINSRCAPLQ